MRLGWKTPSKKLSAALFVTILIYIGMGTIAGTMKPQSLAAHSIALGKALAASPGQYHFAAHRIRGSSGRRVYLFHGLRGDGDFWRIPPFDVVTKHLIERGDEIVIVTLPYALERSFGDGGREYCAAFSRWFDNAQSGYGDASETVVIGTSWGGWHALQIGHKVDKMLVFMPVTKPELLREFDQTSPTACKIHGAPQSLAIYSPSDDRVGDATAALEAIGVPLIKTGGAIHDVGAESIKAAIRWLDT